MPTDDPRLILSKLLHDMRDDNEGFFQRWNIRKCRKILEAHLAAIENVPDAASAREQVRRTVLKLNALNERSFYPLIETWEREQICAIIAVAGARRGFNTEDEDLSVEWRDW